MKLCRKKVLNALYQVFVFLCRLEIQDGRPSLWLAETFFDFFSATAEWILTKLDRKQVLNALYQVCVFCADRKSRMAALASDWLKHFSASFPQPLNGFLRNLTGSKSWMPSIKFVFFVPMGHPRWPPWALIGWNIFDFSATAEWILKKLDRKQVFNALFQLCVFRADQSSKMAALASDWLKHFSTSSLKPLNGFWRNLTGSKSSMPSIKFVFFVPMGHPRWPPWALIGWNIFDFFSAAAEWILKKLDRKQVLNALYQVCVFRADQSSKMAALASDWLKYFSTTSPEQLNGFWWNDRKQVLNVLYQVCVFRADRLSKMAALVSDWLKHFRLLLFNHWMDFDDTWHEASPQCPLSSLCFCANRSSKMAALGCDRLKYFSTSSLQPVNEFWRNLIGSKSSMHSFNFVFFVPIGYLRWPLASDWLKHFSTSPQPLNKFWRDLTGCIPQRPLSSLCFSCQWVIQDGRPGLWLAETFFDFFFATPECILTELDRRQVLNALYQVCVFRADRLSKMTLPPIGWNIFRLLLCSNWMDFDKTWQEELTLPSLCFLCRSVIWEMATRASNWL